MFYVSDSGNEVHSFNCSTRTAEKVDGAKWVLLYRGKNVETSTNARSIQDVVETVYNARIRSVVTHVVVNMDTRLLKMAVLILMSVPVKQVAQTTQFATTLLETILVIVMLVFKVIFVKTSMSVLPKQTTVIAMPNVRIPLEATHVAATTDTMAMVKNVWRVTVMTFYARKP